MHKSLSGDKFAAIVDKHGCFHDSELLKITFDDNQSSMSMLLGV